MGRINLFKVKKAPLIRKMAMGTWKTAKDPSVYGFAEIDMLNAMNALDDYNKKHGVKVTPTHLVGRAITYCMQKRPEVNGLIRGSRIYLRKEVDLFFQVSIPGKGHDKRKGADLSGTVVKKAETKTLAEIAKELTGQADKMKHGDYGDLKKSMNIFKLLPWWFTGIFLDFISWLNYGLNLNLSWLGVPKDPFGSVMITNVGGLGVEVAWAPLVPYSRVPVLLTVGSIRKKPWVVDDKVEIRPIMAIGVTFDHRFVDGIHVAQMAEDFKYCFAHPEKILLNDDFDMEGVRTDYL
jgi:pyruvate dehydrogenase E2 component (dihydrolipoamide acetyltransferase)